LKYLPKATETYPLPNYIRSSPTQTALFEKNFGKTSIFRPCLCTFAHILRLDGSAVVCRRAPNMHHSGEIILKISLKMAVYYSKEKVTEIVTAYGGEAKNTGSTEAQIALMTYRIEKLSDHLREFRNDNSCKKALLSLVGRRRRMLNYLASKDILKYRQILGQLNIRK
jgi:small subunit ribosomal protein S15